MHDIPEFLLAAQPRTPALTKPDEEAGGYGPLLARWLIEMALFFGWHKRTKKGSSILDDDSFLMATGIDADAADQAGEAHSLRLLNARLKELGERPVSDNLGLFANIAFVGRMLGLGNAEMALLGYAAVVSVFSVFKSVMHYRTQEVSCRRFAQLLAQLTGQPAAEIQASFRDDAPLIAAGMVELDARLCDLEDKIGLLTGFHTVLLQPDLSEDALCGRFLKRAPEPALSVDDFPHLAKDTALLETYVRNALHANAAGVNVLLHGLPGTGKTEFAKALAHAAGAELYEISFADAAGHPIRGEARLRAYHFCQRLLARRKNALLLFDEVEDVFPDRGGDTAGKAWINRALESNATPAFWITNHAGIDPAYLRRFDYSVRFPVPSRQVRMSVARHHLAQFDPPDAWLVAITANEQTTPAQYERAAKVARICADPLAATSLVEQALDRSATLLGQKRAPQRHAPHADYDRRYINAGIDADAIIASLKQRPRGTFCFYGPPGTGKTEFARHIAEETGMPLFVRRASDILDKWLGQSERNIADMFAQARQQNAVLLLDEADSLLADRREAEHGWQVTQVNELLTQMEACDGIFICTTNLMQRLDQASLRRFAFKVRFDYLTPNQRWSMFMDALARHGDAGSAGQWEGQVRALDQLAPGDFAVAARQFDVLGMPVTAEGLFRQLEQECRLKNGQSRPVGFVAAGQR